MFASQCYQEIKSLAVDLLKRCPLDSWNVLSGNYKQYLLVEQGQWKEGVFQTFDHNFLKDFEKKLKELLVC